MLVNEWVERRKPPKVRANTYRFYQQSIKHTINPHVGDQNASRLKPIIIEEFLDKLVAKGYNAGTITGVVRTMFKAFKDVEKLGLIPNNPMTKVKTPNLESTSKRSVVQDDLKKTYQVVILKP